LAGSHTPAVVAVSGGSDSMALLVKSAKAYNDAGHSARLLAVTVDHGLRPCAADEARAVGDVCAGLGIAHRICRWDGPKPDSGLQDTARHARYRLLSDAARAHGARIVLTGHTMDDCIETARMRAARAVTVRAMAAIAPATLFDGDIWFLRPLLNAHRVSLRADLSSAGYDWFDDPSNADQRFERVRVRHDSTGDLHLWACKILRARHTIRQYVDRCAALIRDRAMVLQVRHDPAEVTVNADILYEDGGLDALAFILCAVGAKPDQPSADSRTALDAFVTSPQRNGAALTIHGCLVTFRDKRFHICREARNRDKRDGFSRRLTTLHDHGVFNALRDRAGLAKHRAPYPIMRCIDHFDAYHGDLLGKGVYGSYLDSNEDNSNSPDKPGGDHV